ncbi:unnamed protein product [Lampetra planeri]
MSARRRSRGTPRCAKPLEEATRGVQEEEEGAAEGGPGGKEIGAAAQCGRLTVAEWQQRGDHETALLLPLLCRGDLAQLSVATMTQRRLSIGRPALLCSPHAQTVCVAWPASGVPTGRIRLQPRALASLRIAPGQEVCVQPITGPVLPAQLLELVMSRRRFSVIDFCSICAVVVSCRLEEGKVLLPRNVLSFNYFGRPYDLQVVAVRGQGGGAEKDVDPNYASCFEAEPSGSNSSGRSPPLQQEVPVTGVPGPVSASSESEGVPAFDENAFEGNICARLEDMALQTSPETSWSPDSKADAVHPPPGSDASLPPCQDAAFDVVKTAPCFCVKFHVGDLFCISKGTRVKVELGNAPSTTVLQQQQQPVTYADIGGLGPQLQAIREDIELPLLHPEVFTQLGVCPPRGVILHGSPGTGKTMIAQAVAHETRAHFYLVNGPEIFNRFYGESEARLRKVFQEASLNPPALVFIDELDALCPARGDGGGGGDDVGRRVVATLLTLMDGLGSERSRGQLLVLAATNRLHAIDPALRRPGRFDRELEVPPPDATGRRAILERLLGRTGLPHVVTGPEVAALARATHAYTGADLTALLKEGGMQALRRARRHESDPSDASLCATAMLTTGDLWRALKDVRPSAMREVTVDVPAVQWGDIGGLEDVKTRLRQAIEWPLAHPEAFMRLGVTPPRGLLLYGPPGCSKTMIARALATESHLNFISIKGAELLSKWVGESERAVREVFRKARAAAPSILFFDEIDVLAGHRGSSAGSSGVSDRVLAQMLTEMDGIQPLNDVVVIAATNRPDAIDQALLRPGRIDRILYVPLPDFTARAEILRLRLKGVPLAPDVCVDALARDTHGYSGAELVCVCREAAMLALSEDMSATSIAVRHFHGAVSIVTPRISTDMLQYYRDYQQRSGLHPL